MIVEQIANDGLPTLRLDDSVQKSVALMLENKVFELPVLDEGSLIGVASWSKLDLEDQNEPIGAFRHDFRQIAVQQYSNISEALFLMRDFGVTMLPVINSKNELVATLSQNDILLYFSKILGGSSKNDAVLVLEMGVHDYSLSQIARLTESNNAQIMSSFVSAPDQNMNIMVTLQFNVSDLTYIVATLERFDYHIVYQFHQSNVSSVYDERYESLMKYLSIG